MPFSTEPPRNESAISSNTKSIKKNTLDISKNTQDISKNTLDISNNTESINKNTLDISNNTESITKNILDISKNTLDISKNTLDISNNTESIAKNTLDISKNTLDISNNTESITKNILDISKNTLDISKNTLDISNNTESIAKNTLDISKNTLDISNNRQYISTNTALIAINTQDISNNRQDISELQVATQNMSSTGETTNFFITNPDGLVQMPSLSINSMIWKQFGGDISNSLALRTNPNSDPNWQYYGMSNAISNDGQFLAVSAWQTTSSAYNLVDIYQLDTTNNWTKIQTIENTNNQNTYHGYYLRFNQTTQGIIRLFIGDKAGIDTTTTTNFVSGSVTMYEYDNTNNLFLLTITKYGLIEDYEYHSIVAQTGDSKIVVGAYGQKRIYVYSPDYPQNFTAIIKIPDDFGVDIPSDIKISRDNYIYFTEYTPSSSNISKNDLFIYNIANYTGEVVLRQDDNIARDISSIPSQADNTISRSYEGGLDISDDGQYVVLGRSWLSAEIYRVDHTTDTITLLQTIKPDLDTGFSGEFAVNVSMSADGSRIAVSYNPKIQYSGGAIVYETTDYITWRQIGNKISGDDYFDGIINNTLNTKIDLTRDGSTLVIGYPYAEDTQTVRNAGVVKTYSLNYNETMKVDKDGLVLFEPLEIDVLHVKDTIKFPNNNNIHLGHLAGDSASRSAQNNIRIGYEAGFQHTQDENNTIAIGSRSGSYGQNKSSIAIGYFAGHRDKQQNSIAIGIQSGYDKQQPDGISIGNRSGYLNQSDNAIAIGHDAGFKEQQPKSVAIGPYSGSNNQQFASIALGYNAGNSNQQQSSIAIGRQSGNNQQQQYSIAIGDNAGKYNLGDSSIAIGKNAGYHMILDSENSDNNKDNILIGTNCGTSPNDRDNNAANINNCIYIGRDINPLSPNETTTNEIILGSNISNNVIGRGSNSMILGNQLIERVILPSYSNLKQFRDLVIEEVTPHFDTDNKSGYVIFKIIYNEVSHQGETVIGKPIHPNFPNIYIYSLYFDDGKPGYIFFEVEMDLTDAQTLHTLSFELHPPIYNGQLYIDPSGSLKVHETDNLPINIVFPLIYGVQNSYGEENTTRIFYNLGSAVLIIEAGDRMSWGILGEENIYQEYIFDENTSHNGYRVNVKLEYINVENPATDIVLFVKRFNNREEQHYIGSQEIPLVEGDNNNLILNSQLSETVRYEQVGIMLRGSENQKVSVRILNGLITLISV